MKFPILLLLFSFLISTQSFAVPQCISLFQFETTKKSKILEQLKRKIESRGESFGDIQVLVLDIRGNSELKNDQRADAESIDVIIKVRGLWVVRLELDRLFLNGKKINAFQTHSSLEDDRFQGRGFGTLGYLVASRIAHRIFNAPTYSTQKPDPTTALLLWRRLVDLGLATHESDPFDETSAGPKRKRFKMIDEVLNSGEPDLIDLLIEKMEWEISR